jgi:hypothetical protein
VLLIEREKDRSLGWMEASAKDDAHDFVCVGRHAGGSDG